MIERRPRSVVPVLAFVLSCALPTAAFALSADDVAGTLDAQPVSVGDVDRALGGGVSRKWAEMGAVQRHAAYALCRERAYSLMAEEARVTPIDWRAHIWSSTEVSAAEASKFRSRNAALFAGTPDEPEVAVHTLRVKRYRERLVDKADKLIGDSFKLNHLIDTDVASGADARREHARRERRLLEREPRPPFVAATCLGSSVTREEIERFAAVPLYRLRADVVTTVCRQLGVEDSNPIMLQRIAAQRGMRVSELLAFIDAVPGPPTDDEVAAKAVERYGDASETSLFKARVALEAARRGDERRHLVDEVRRKAKGSCSLELPAPPVADARGRGVGKGPTTGLRVQYFGGLRCSHCEGSWEILKGVHKRHTSDVRVEFRHHFPDTVLPLFEDAIALECSARQGKLWHFGDWVARGGLTDSAARDLDLDEAAYRACLEDPKTAVKILDDTAEALRLGFRQAVPSWVVGRRPRRGYQGELAIEEAIEREQAAWAARAPSAHYDPRGGGRTGARAAYP